MAKGNALFQLVHGLSRSEKRYFRKLVAFGSGRSRTNASVLFDCLEDMKAYDREELRVRLAKHGIAPQLQVYQTLLFDQLMRVLRMTRRKDDLLWKMRKELTDVEILYELNILEACEKKVEKNLALCRTHHLHSFAAELHAWQYKLRMNKSKSGLDEGFRENQLQRLATGRLVMEEIEASVAEALSRRMLRKDSFRRRSEMRTSLLEIIARIGTAAPQPEANFSAWSSWQRARANLAFIDKDIEAALAGYRDFLAAWEGDESWIHRRPEVYLSVLNNYMNCCHLVKKPHLYLEKIDRLFNFPISRPDMNNQFQFTALSQKLTYSMHYCSMEETETVIREFENWLDDPAHHAPVSRLLVIYFNIVSVSFVHDKFRIANRWLNRILVSPGKTERRDIREFARIFQVVLHFELENFDLVENLISATQRHLRIRKRYDAYAHFILSFFRVALYDGKIPEKALGEFRETLQTYEDLPVSGRPNGVIELSLWAQSKFEGKSIQECFRERVIHKEEG